MTADEELIGLRKQMRAAQALIQLQRVQLRRVRETRLALVAGKHAEQVNPAVEAGRVEEFLQPAEGIYGDLLGALGFYADANNYRDQLGVPSGSAAVPADGGSRARAVLRKLK